MDNLERVSATLICSLEEIGLLHGLTVVKGQHICGECRQIWPCSTSSLIARAKTAGARHMEASVAHIQGGISRRENTLQKIDEYFSALKCDEAEIVISLTHKLCVASSVQVFGYVNAVGQHEYQVERLIDAESSLPLWSMTIGRGLGVRVFSPSISYTKEPFFERILQLGLHQPEVQEIVEWWAGLSESSSTYVTSVLPTDKKSACDVIIKLCKATAEFCDAEWQLMNEFL